MKIILDEMVPVDLVARLPGHEVHHVISLGWRHVSNGALLKLSEESGFEVFVTKDGNMSYQQNLSGRSISILVIRPSNQSSAAIVGLSSQLLAALADLAPGSVRTVSPTGFIDR